MPLLDRPSASATVSILSGAAAVVALKSNVARGGADARHQMCPTLTIGLAPLSHVMHFLPSRKHGTILVQHKLNVESFVV
ncbi:hypothetical protein ON010_g17205 [Phytophthora cinnamomi]|nr:hypothetical protein ON010_g17205 [Phytophthora cinnamomi]